MTPERRREIEHECLRLTFDPAAAIRILEFQDRYQWTDEGWRFSYRKPLARLQSSAGPGK